MVEFLYSIDKKANHDRYLDCTLSAGFHIRGARCPSSSLSRAPSLICHSSSSSHAAGASSSTTLPIATAPAAAAEEEAEPKPEIKKEAPSDE